MIKRFPSSLRRDMVIGAALLLTLLLVPLVADKGIVFVAGTLALQIVFGLSWNLMFGQTGLVSFGHASFFAIGGYTYAVIARALPDLHILLVLVASVLACVALALLVGLVALRRSTGVYFAILTLALSQIVHLLLSYIPSLGREDGFTGILRPEMPLGMVTFDLSAGFNYYYFMIICCAVLVAMLWWVIHGPIGRRFKSMQQDPVRAEFLGINVHGNRLASFSMAAGLASAAGALYGPWLQLLTPELAHWSESARPILYTLLGGVQSFWGPVLGAIGFSLLEYGTRTMIGLSEIVIGSILLIVVLGFPGGILGGAEQVFRRLRRPSPKGGTRK